MKEGNSRSNWLDSKAF